MDFIDLLRTPGYKRAVALRRAAAVALVLCAGLSALLNRASSDPRVVVFARDVQPGTVLAKSDVDLRPLPVEASPPAALTSVDAVEGQIVASHASPGEVVTPTRLIGPDLTRALVGDDAGKYTMVPVKLAEPDIIPMLHHGDHVSVVTAGDGSPQTVADSGIVILAGTPEDENSSSVLLLLRHGDAAAVAAASLTSPLAVVIAVSS